MTNEVPGQIRESQSWRDFERDQEMPRQALGPFGNVLVPATLTDLTQCLALGSARGVLAWRGQAKVTWRIDSTLIRRLQTMGWLLRGRAGEEANVLEAERRLLERARLAGHGFDDWRELADLELLARLRHHGAATRLVDCTRNAYVAAWFAATQEFEETGAIIGFGERQPYVIDTQAGARMPLCEVLRRTKGRLALWTPGWLSPRIAAQQAVFVFGQVTRQPWGSLPLHDEVLANAGDVPGSLVIAVTPALKSELVDQLQVVHGLYAERLFPDLDGFAGANGPDSPFPADFGADWRLP